MASLTKKTRTIRKNKRAAMGQGRKRELRKGTTPVFPVHADVQDDPVLPAPPRSIAEG